MVSRSGANGIPPPRAASRDAAAILQDTKRPVAPHSCRACVMRDAVCSVLLGKRSAHASLLQIKVKIFFIRSRKNAAQPNAAGMCRASQTDDTPKIAANKGRQNAWGKFEQSRAASRPAIAGRGDRTKCGGRGAGIDTSPSLITKLRVRRRLHHPSRYALRMVPLPHYRGGGYRGGGCALSFSRRHRARVSQHYADTPRRHRLDPVVHAEVRLRNAIGKPEPVSLPHGLPDQVRQRRRKKKIQGSGTPTDALSHVRTSGCGSRHGECRLAPTLRCGRARLPAFHHGSRPRGVSSPKAQLQAMLPGARPERSIR